MHHVALALYPGFQALNLAVSTVLEFANRSLGEPLYKVHLLSEHGGPVLSSGGFSVGTEPFGKRRFDTVLVVGDNDVLPTPPALVKFLQRAARTSRRIGATCTGAFNLAEAGVLDGRRATTHWYYAEQLRRRFPNVGVEEDRIFIIDGPVWTSAGMSACIDLALALVEKDAGAAVARDVAKLLVVYHRRAGGQSQFSALLDLEPRSDRIRAALDFARQNLQQELSVEQLADAAHLSPRQFARAFRDETGQTPAKAVEHLRVEAARLMMEGGRHAIDVVARDTGFGDRERMRRAFLRAFGQPPQAIRRMARGDELQTA
ncbi:Transcriptional regulator GlxA, contains an amidase domain and an AraC-type DNA-binding HTH domain [Cupriavidus necator]|uniref:GlxA family transcriptional regulator n=1 Tax=Cupriavidus necator (strain ATCC 17699 / DSM 428 / KCTC 22496 / NCIMB 10442 / H16 / Stanier 337) TaxID=381666 RepID=Q0K0A3_CUPNH|nr:MULTISPECIES: GlxA family transcriptional regulator [Cupriavidus]EON20676.1 AraC family transcriptional regulator [Cupriavidus sp. GA3-3]KUE90666.1 AraC family transcriptional regulator [Cupriavidus necator]QCC04400.1 GlxA family transcriptional regulator [Cupriavidus necator H16]QQB79087.1 GlxA family transcriptional regulator [Cupriavidus necator]WKA43309.1 GlxA family transcriptional regulator [Cupriavidus necator]